MFPKEHKTHMLEERWSFVLLCFQGPVLLVHMFSVVSV